MAFDSTKSMDVGPNGLAFDETLHFVTSGVDSPVGNAAPLWSRYYRTNGELWVKSDVLDADWTVIRDGLDTVGSAFFYDEDETLSVTSSTIFQLKLRLSVDVTNAGEYLVVYTADMATANGTSKSVEIKFELDDSIILSDNVVRSTGGDFQTVTGFRRTTLSAGTHTVDAEHKSISGSSSIQRVRMYVVRAD